MPENIGIFILTIFIGSLGIASATTIISALLAKANTKNALFPILSFPILIPVIILGIELTKYSFHDTGRIDPASNINLIIAYCGLMIVASYFLFDFVWED
jgi:heme exporter protein B